MMTPDVHPTDDDHVHDSCHPEHDASANETDDDYAHELAEALDSLARHYANVRRAIPVHKF